MKEYNIWQMSLQYTRLTMKAWFQYRVDAILRSLAVFLREATGIIAIWFMLLKFDSLNGWNQKEMLFLYSLIFLTYGIMIIFFTGLRDFFDFRFPAVLPDPHQHAPRGLLLELQEICRISYQYLSQSDSILDYICGSICLCQLFSCTVSFAKGGYEPVSE